MQENKEDRRASGIKTYGTVKENLKVAIYSAIGLVVSFGIMVFVAKSGIVYNMMMGVAAFSAISLIFTLCKALLLFIKGKKKPSINKESGEKQRHKAKVVPVRIASDKQENKTKQMRKEPKETEILETVEDIKKKKPILTYSLAALCLALGVLCVYQGIQIADLTGKALPWETNRTVLVTANYYVDSRYHSGDCSLSKKNAMRKISEKKAISSGYKKCHACFG